MKKPLLIAMTLMFATIICAQKDVTQFLGLPVDGSKSEMIQKIKAKGYRNNPYNKDLLDGEFNGRDVHIQIMTNNNKVWRIGVVDANADDEKNIQIRFNNLCEQFKNNSKYVSFQDYSIPDEEDINYEMNVNNKRYQAVFYQKPTTIDSTTTKKEIRTLLLSKYSEEQLANPTEEMQSDILELSLEYMTEKLSKKTVWFMIDEKYGKYRIIIFYENLYNSATGEDL